MALVLILLAIAVALACLTLVASEFWAVVHGNCWKCRGRGTVLVRGERVPLDELTSRDYAEYLVEGTHFYRAKVETCPRCNGSGLK